jgi:hypothetical protein
MFATNLWTTYFSLFELTTIMRQRDAAIFAGRLNRLREGNHTDEDMRAFEERRLSVASNRLSYSPLQRHMFGIHKKVDAHNRMAVGLIEGEYITIRAMDMPTSASLSQSL